MIINKIYTLLIPDDYMTRLMMIRPTYVGEYCGDVIIVQYSPIYTFNLTFKVVMMLGRHDDISLLGPIHHLHAGFEKQQLRGTNCVSDHWMSTII